MSDFKENVPAAVAQIISSYLEAKSTNTSTTSLNATDLCNLVEALTCSFLTAGANGNGQRGHELWRELQDVVAAAKSKKG